METKKTNPQKFKSINEECEYYKKHFHIIEKKFISLQKDFSKLVEEKKKLLQEIEKQKKLSKELGEKLSSSNEKNSDISRNINTNKILNTLESESDLPKKAELTENNEDDRLSIDCTTTPNVNEIDEMNEHPEIYEEFHKDLYKKEKVNTLKQRLSVTQLTLNNINTMIGENDKKDVYNKTEKNEDIASPEKEKIININQEIINTEEIANSKIFDEEESKAIENFLSVNFIVFDKDVTDFRKLIFENENKVNKLYNILKHWYYYSKVLKKGIKGFGKAAKILNDNLIPNKQTISIDCPDLLSQIYVLQKILGDIFTYCSSLIESVDSFFIKEIEKDVKKYFQGIKKQRLNFSKNYAEFLDFQSKFLNSKKTKKDFITLKESYYKKYIELLEYKYDYICMINQISMFTRLKLPELVSLLNISIISFFNQFNEENKSILSFEKDNLEKLLSKVKIKNKIVEKMTKQRENISKTFKNIDTSLILKEGFLNIKDSWGFKRRYVKFQNGNIVQCKLSKYNEKEENTKVNSHLNYIEKINPDDTTIICSLLFCNVKQFEKNYNYPFCFEVVNGKTQKTFFFQAETEYESLEWINSIQNAIGNQIMLLDDNDKGTKTQRYSAKRKSLSVENRKSIKDKNNNEIKKKLAKTIKNESEIKNQSGIYIDLLINEYKCADCGEKKPTWLNTNWLTLVCIECSGIHRNLGVQVSKIRSLKLDNISQEYIELLCAIKQNLINAVLEQELPKNFEKPNPTSPRELKEKFIIEKYKEKKFIKNSDINNIELLIFEAIQNNELLNIYKLLKTSDIDINGIYKINEEEYGFVHHCAKLGKLTLLKLFYVLGADVNKKDGKGLKPIDYAEKNEQNEVSEYLRTKKSKD